MNRDAQVNDLIGIKILQSFMFGKWVRSVFIFAY